MELETSPRSNAVYHAEIAVRPAPGDVPHTTTRTDKARCLPNTNRIHVLICVLTIVVVICVAVVLSLVLKKKDDGPPLVRPADIDVTALPVTPLSSDTRATMLSMMDKSVNPCDDMYRYACGGFIKKTKVEEQFSDPYNYKFNTIDNRTRTQIQTILEQDTNVVGRFYSSCLNTTDIETYNKSAILPYLEYITRSVTNLNSYYRVLGQLKRTGLMDKVHVQVDFTTTPDTQIWVLVLNPVASNKSPDSNYIYPLLGLIGMDRTSIMQAYNLASSMYNTYTRTASQPLKLISRSDLRSVIPGMDAFIEGLGDASLTTTGSVPSTTDAIDRVVIPRFSTLQAIHNTLVSTSPDILRNYLIMQFMVAAVPYLPTYFQNAYNYVPGKTMNEFNPFSTFTFGMRDAEEEAGALDLSDDSRYDDTIHAFLNQRPSRASICATATVSLFPDDIGKQWIDRFFPTEHKALVARLSSMMQAGVSLRMYNNPWLDKTTKRAALEKASQMIQNLIINSNLQLVPSWLPLTGHFLWDLSVASSWYADQALTKLLGSRLKRTSMPPGVAATVANAFYYPAANSVNLVGGLILTPFFDSNYPFWLNVASYGSVIGHEFTHGFDDTGRLFDASGRVIPWWTDSATSAFQSRAQCLINDYNQYTVVTPKGTKRLDGKLTLGENIADIGGYAVAWDVYRAMPPQPRLFDDITNDQAFWVAAAQTWCGVVSPEASEQLLSGDVHSPGEARVNVAMSHRPEVATAFNCPSYTRMGKSLTSQRCEVW